MKKAIAIILSIMLVLVITFPAAAISTIAVKSINLNSSKITLKVGETTNLIVTLTPANTSQKKLSFVTNNKHVATVNSEGVIKGVHEGYVIINVYTLNKKIFAQCKVTVKQPEKVTLKVWKFGSPQIERDYMVKKNIVFEGKNPWIKIEWVYQNWDTKRTKIISSHQANTLPDIMIVDAQNVPEFATMGALLALDEIDKQETEEWKSKFVKEAWQVGIYKDKLYSFAPFADLVPMLAYNTKMFKTAGIVDAKGNARAPKNWEELLDIAMKLTKDGIHGIGLPATKGSLDMNMLEGIAFRNGGRWLDKDKIVVNDKGFIDTVQFYKDLSKFAPKGFLETNFRTAAEMFFQGKTSMVITMSFAPILKAQFTVAPDFEYKLAPFPLRSSKTGSFAQSNFLMSESVSFTISRQVTDKNAAMKYLDFWTTKEAQEGWTGSAVVGRVPTLKANLESWEFERQYPDLSKEYRTGRLFAEAVGTPGFAGLTEAEDKLGVALQEVLIGSKEPKKALDELQVTAQEIYNQANKK